MITFFSEDSALVDRHLATVYMITAEARRFEYNGNSMFVMLEQGKLETDDGDVVAGLSTSCVNTGFTVSGKGMVIDNPGYSIKETSFVKFTAGRHGNLSYIDGCSNSNLIHPSRNGEPCTNYLYFPPGINQTFHTHPSYRVGLVLTGNGFAEVGSPGNTEIINLAPGTMFNLHCHANHRFFTEDSHMSLMVYHPDSEDGPRDEHNPMKTRTYITR